LTVWWKIVVEGDETGYTFTLSSTNYHSGVLYEIQGADATSPIDQSDSNTGSQTTPTVTPTVIGTLALAGLATDNHLDCTAVSSGWTIDEEARPAYHATYGASRDTLRKGFSATVFETS